MSEDSKQKFHYFYFRNDKYIPLKKRGLESIEATESTETKKAKLSDDDTVGETVTDPVGTVAGTGSGADNNAVPDNDTFIMEEVTEETFTVVGFGSGVPCDAGNPELAAEAKGRNAYYL